MFELKDVSGVEESQDAKPVLQDVDIVAIPRNFDTSDSAWLHHPFPNMVLPKKGRSRRGDSVVTRPIGFRPIERIHRIDSEMSAREFKTEQKKNNTIATSQEPDLTKVTSAGLRTTPDTVAPGNPQRIVHWLKDEEMLRETFKFGRILLLRLTNTLSPQHFISVDCVAGNLLRLLSDTRKSCRERPIVFVGHNIGVVVIEKALMLASKSDPSADQIFYKTAGIVYLTTPDCKTEAETEEEWDYFDTTTRMHSDREHLRHQEALTLGSIEQHLKEFRATLEAAENIALKDAEGTVSHEVNARPSAISLNRYQLLDNIVNTDDVVYLKIVNAIASSLECYRLLSAAFEGDDASLRTLLDCGIGVNLQDRTGNAALHLAAISGHKETVKLLLLEYKANVALQNSKGRSALFLAVDSGKNNTEIVTLLLEKGARVTPLMLSNNSRVSDDIKKLLMNPPFVHGPDNVVNTKTWPKPTAPKSAAAQDACESFRAVVAEFFQFGTKEKFVLEDPSIDELLYKSDPETILEKARDHARNAESMNPDTLKQALRCRWYHIPANNVGGRCILSA